MPLTPATRALIDAHVADAAAVETSTPDAARRESERAASRTRQANHEAIRSLGVTLASTTKPKGERP